MIERMLAACGVLALGCTCAQVASPIVIDRPGDNISILPLADNAARVKIGDYIAEDLDELIYLPADADIPATVKDEGGKVAIQLPQMLIVYDKTEDALSYYNAAGERVLSESAHGRHISPSRIQNAECASAGQRFCSPPDEHLYGTGQFQDGYLDIRGLQRRLTQVNTQISLPLVVSNKGYALLWNNYGLTEFNPSARSIALQRKAGDETTVTVDVTSTEGGKQETRRMNVFEGTLPITEAGDYSLMLDVGQAMARKYKIAIDDSLVMDINNLWLPPTTSFIMALDSGDHHVEVEGERNDSPSLYWHRVEDATEWMSPVADGIDYTVFVGNPEQAIATFRQVSGQVPMLPAWAYGYVHCRERYDSQGELLENAHEFRNRNIPIDAIVQDWQWWGKHGWNAMKFDEDKYPDPKAMLDDLHAHDMKLMISVWAKIDKNSELGKICQERGCYIPDTDWIDFFNPEAADFYWQNQSSRLLQPYGIDAWWQDATEPENDDLRHRRIQAGKLPGEFYGNTFPLMVNRRVHAGLKQDDAQHRAMILTRSAFPGIQRYGVVTWSGDVGNDWETLRRQITGGLGQMAAGLPWWTFDAGGFFRPGDQHTNADYQEAMLRWLQVGAFLPMMRVHGYMSQTEPWRYGPEVEEKFVNTIKLRYSLMPYIYSAAAAVSHGGSTMMRPLVMDFPHDAEALAQKYEYMFGPSILVAPVLAPGVESWRVYLPQGSYWVDFYTGDCHAGGQYVDVPVDIEKIPLMVRAGSIVPRAWDKQFVADKPDAIVELQVYPGADGNYMLYEDAGDGYGYEAGQFSWIPIAWDDAKGSLSIGVRQGSYPGMPATRKFAVKIPGKLTQIIQYDGTAVSL